MAAINLLPDEEETLEVRKEIQEKEKKEILKLLLGENYAEDSNVLSFFKSNWYSELENYFQRKQKHGVNYQKKFEKLINKMDKLIQKHKVEEDYIGSGSI